MRKPWYQILATLLTATATTLALASSVFGQAASELSEEARQFVSVDATTVALENVKVVDGTGAPPREGQTVLILDGRIAAVGDDVAIPEEAERLDMSGHTVLPRLVGVHNHTFYTTAVRTSQMNVTAGSRPSVPLEAIPPTARST